MSLKILTTVKRVVDYNTRVRIKADGSGIETEQIKMSINPFDEIAVEASIRLKEAHLAHEIVVVSIGTRACQETLRTALAMGADRGILLETEQSFDPLQIATLLKLLVEEEAPDLVLMGKQAIDDDYNQTGQMLAGLLSWSQATFVSEIEIQNKEVKVTREIDEGLQKLKLVLPAVITTDLRLNVPRYISLPNLMKSKQKPLEIRPLSAIEKSPLDHAPHLTLLKMEPPPARKQGIRVHSVEELINKLKNEANVLRIIR